jgi:hypothetical protein
MCKQPLEAEALAGKKAVGALEPAVDKKPVVGCMHRPAVPAFEEDTRRRAEPAPDGRLEAPEQHYTLPGEEQNKLPKPAREGTVVEPGVEPELPPF